MSNFEDTKRIYQLPKAVESQRIDRIGMSIVDRTFANDWQYRQIPGKDVGKDCELELIENGVYTGCTFTVQVKSRTVLEKNKNSDDYSVTLKISTINYCLNKKVPFLILLVNVITADIYYLHVQEYLINTPEINKKLRSKDQQNLTLRVPMENLVKNKQQELKEIVKKN